MSKRVAIVQSNYIPWKGYFDLIAGVDEFILFDDVQYTRRDWRNRNKIIVDGVPQWLTIPVAVSGKYYQKINETRIDDETWRRSHLSAIDRAYRCHPAHAEVWPWLTECYDRASSVMLSEVNETLIRAMCERLDINTRISRSSDYDVIDGKSERLMSLCTQAGASVYVSGPAARAYLDEPVFAQAGIEVRWKCYDAYPPYAQIMPVFEHGVSILDLFFSMGSEAAAYIHSTPFDVPHMQPDELYA